MNPEDHAKKIINDNLYMTISVCDLGSNPWTSNLFYCFDKKYNFYWYSSKDSRHSRILTENPKTSVSIFNSLAIGKDVSAIYMEGKSNEITSRSDILKILPTYMNRMIKKEIVQIGSLGEQFVKNAGDFLNDSPLRMYKFTPDKIWTLNEPTLYKDKFIDSKIEVNLT